MAFSYLVHCFLINLYQSANCWELLVRTGTSNMQTEFILLRSYTTVPKPAIWFPNKQGCYDLQQKLVDLIPLQFPQNIISRLKQVLPKTKLFAFRKKKTKNKNKQFAFHLYREPQPIKRSVYTDTDAPAPALGWLKCSRKNVLRQFSDPFLSLLVPVAVLEVLIDFAHKPLQISVTSNYSLRCTFTFGLWKFWSAGAAVKSSEGNSSDIRGEVFN